MSNIATVLKAEILRLSRKEVREEASGLKKAVATQRAEIASLKRRLAALEAVVKRVEKSHSAASSARSSPRSDESSQIPPNDDRRLRFSAQGLAANRKRLGLSAADLGRLIGVTGQSIYAWETGKTAPRAAAVQAIAALRGIGKREITRRLQALES